MARPVIATKLYLPRRRAGLVTRPRLREGLRRGTASRLTLVSAPAGFGKTTLLAEWLDETAGDDRAVAWVSLDAADGDPASFWTYVVTALGTALPGIGSEASELLSSVPLPTEPLLSSLVNELAAAPGEIWLVLDDYHLVDSHEVGTGLAFLLEHLPPHVHVVLSTRADPDLPLSRWRVRGELTEIRAGDLRFTPDEAAVYLDTAVGRELAPADLAVLAERTEGWIAALQLAALSLQGREDVSGFVARFAGDDRYVVDYLVEEVLRHQPEPVRTFLLQSSVLDRLTGPLADAVTDRHDGSDMLRTLERANLFLVPLDDRREWYRYHHLFADVLRARLLAEQPDLVPVLHRRACRWHQHHDLPEDAVRHALAARDVDHAAYLVELAVPGIRRNRQEALLLGWLQALPDEVVRRHPVLSVFYGYMLMASGDLDGVESRLDDAERALAAAPDGSDRHWADTDELRTLPATLAVHRASLAQARGDVTGTTAHARRALDLAGPDDHLARGSAAGFLGLAAWARGDVSDALETFTQAIAALHAAGNLVDELSGTVVLGDLWLAAGRPSAARGLYRRALQVADSLGDAVRRAVPDLHVGVGELDQEAGDLVGAGRQLEEAAALGEGGWRVESRYRWFVAGGRIAQAEGDPEKALGLLDRAEELYRPGFFPDVRPIAALRARVQIGRGDLSPAADWARARGVSVADDASYLSEFDHLTLVRLVLARHRVRPDVDALDRASGLLARLLDAAESSGRAGSALEIRLLVALVQDARGRRPQARQTLAHAWAQAPEPDAYVRLFLDEGAPLVTLLRDVANRDDPDGHARRLLGFTADRDATNGDAAGPAADRHARATAPSAVESLSDRELQVLRLLDSDLTGPEIARELFVSHNTLRTHTRHIFTKLDVTSRRAAVRRARERGLM